jgi:hypothetical protein
MYCPPIQYTFLFIFPALSHVRASDQSVGLKKKTKFTNDQLTTHSPSSQIYLRLWGGYEVHLLQTSGYFIFL